MPPRRPARQRAQPQQGWLGHRPPRPPRRDSGAPSDTGSLLQRAHLGRRAPSDPGLDAARLDHRHPRSIALQQKRRREAGDTAAEHGDIDSQLARQRSVGDSLIAHEPRGLIRRDGHRTGSTRAAGASPRDARDLALEDTFDGPLGDRTRRVARLAAGGLHVRQLGRGITAVPTAPAARPPSASRRGEHCEAHRPCVGSTPSCRRIPSSSLEPQRSTIWAFSKRPICRLRTSIRLPVAAMP